MIGVQHAVTVSSCTTGLQLCLMAIGVKAGDEVIVPAETHVATAHVVEHLGARPIFVDVERATGNIDPAKIEAAITPRTRAIMVVHYLGLPCDMDRICALADERKIPIVEDCALAVGASYGDRRPGAIGLAGAFSFYPAKHITTLEGGMVTTNDDQMAARLRNLRAFGYDRALGERKIPGIYDVVALGHNFRMSEVQAAVGLGQLDQLDDFLATRRRNSEILIEGLSGIEGLVTFPLKNGKASSGCYCVNIVCDASRYDRNTMIERLNAAGVGTSVHYPVAVPLARYYREKYDCKPGDFPDGRMDQQQCNLIAGRAARVCR